MASAAPASQARALAQAGYGVLQVDLLGCGDSTGDFADATWAAWLDDAQAAHRWLAEHGFDPQMGARPMARVIQDKIKRPLAEEILFGELAEHGGVVHIDVSSGELTFDYETTVEMA